MYVYILIEVTELPGFTDKYGEPCPDSTLIVGAYDSEEKANAKKHTLELLSDRDVEEYGCDPLYYKVLRCKVN